MHQAAFFCFYQGTVTSVGLVASPPLQKANPPSPNSHGEKPLFVPGRPGDGALEKKWKTHAVEQELGPGVWEKGGTKKGKLVGATNNPAENGHLHLEIFFLFKMLWDEDVICSSEKSLSPKRWLWFPAAISRGSRQGCGESWCWEGCVMSTFFVSIVARGSWEVHLS